MMNVFAIVGGAMFVVVLVLLIQGYIRTRNFGLILLLIAFPLWGFVSILWAYLTGSLVQRLATGGSIPFPFSLMNDSHGAGHFVSRMNHIEGSMPAVMFFGAVLLLSRLWNRRSTNAVSQGAN